MRVFLTEGNGFVTDNFYYQLTKPLGSALSLEAAVKAGEGETERTLLPEANYDFPDGKKLDIAAMPSIRRSNVSVFLPRILLRASITCP